LFAAAFFSPPERLHALREYGRIDAVKLAAPDASIERFGHAADGSVVEVVTLRNSHQVRARISTRGGTLVGLDAPDRVGQSAAVVLGKPNFEAWELAGPPINAIVGRYANRITGGGFHLDGQFYALSGADPQTDIVSHGGPNGFDRQLWRPTLFEKQHAAGVELQYLSADGENGFPGALDVTVLYTLTDDSVLRIDYRATTTKPTVLNLTHHAYFNLGGPEASSVEAHTLQVCASHYTPIDARQVPTGEIRSVADTPFDFREAREIGPRIRSDHPQITIAKGLNHNFVLDKTRGNLISPAVRLHDVGSGRILTVNTTEPGVQIYTGGFFSGEDLDASGRPVNPGAGIALETQHFPNSPNLPWFPSTILRPGQIFSSTTEFVFSTD
jgi:aldose 1-epimerase